MNGTRSAVDTQCAMPRLLSCVCVVCLCVRACGAADGGMCVACMFVVSVWSLCVGLAGIAPLNKLYKPATKNQLMEVDSYTAPKSKLSLSKGAQVIFLPEH